MMRILCLWLPNWPIQRLIHARPELNGRPVVLRVDTPRGGCVAACSAAAAAGGVRPDMPLAEAKSLVRGLAIEPYEPQTDRRALARLAEACEQFSPCVALEEGAEPESLLLDISNLAHLLGTDAELAGRVAGFFTDRGYRIQIAVADTVGLAWAVAHFGQRGARSEEREEEGGGRKAEGGISLRPPPSAFPLRPTLDDLPIESLRISADTADLLRELGIEHVAQLLPLARESLAARFGDELLRRLDQLTGAAAEVIMPHRPLAPLAAECVLEYPTTDRAAITHILAGLVDQIARQLASRDEGAVLMVCQLGCADGQAVPLRVGLLEPSASARQLMELISLHLETVAPRSEITRVEVRVATVGRLGQRQRELFAQQWPSDPHQLALLVNRLSSRLGYRQVVRPQLCSSPLPERAVRYVPVTGEPALAGGRAGRRGKAEGGRGKLTSHSTFRLPPFSRSSLLAPRPLLLYPEPQPLEVMCVAPDGPPQCVWLGGCGCGCRQRVMRHWGPERIETLWWRGRSVRRDYYRIAVESGSHLWIFRRLADGRWFLHGAFA
jgi:protein ImuB